MDLPKILKVEQSFEDNAIQDVEGDVTARLEKAGITNLVKPGQKIALTLGSRSISNIARVIKTTGEVLKSCGADPFIVLGMGSHGGSTVEGQLKIAEKLGVTEESMNMPIHATMEVVKIGTTDKGLPVFMDRCAYEADGIILIHRVKYHRHMMGPQQSGFLKMLAIGLGKEKGAATVHSLGWGGFPKRVEEVASVAIKNAPVILGIGLVENGFSKTAVIETVMPEDFLARNAFLLQKALELMPRIPFKKVDLLVVKEIGKTVPPDTDILGRPTIREYTEVVPPDPTRIVALDLQDASMGNAAGMGTFDYITRRFYEKIDFTVTAINVIAGAIPEAGKMPPPLDTDRLTIEAGLKNAGFPDVPGVRDINEARVVLMKNTSEMDVLYISESLVDEIEDPGKVEVIGKPFPIPFDDAGNLGLWLEA